MAMRSDKDQVLKNYTESKILDNGKETGCECYGSISEEQDKEKAGNMSGHQNSSECKIGPKNEAIKDNRGSLDDHPVFYIDKNVMARELPEIVVSNFKDVTYNVFKDVCQDEGMPMMQEKLLSNEKDSVNINSKPQESKSSEDSKFEECVGIQDSSKLNQENVIVTEKEAKDDSKVPPWDVTATSRSVSKEAITLRDIILMEDSQRPPNTNNINGPEENVDRETEQEKKDEPVAESLRYLSYEMAESENQRLNDVLEDAYDYHLFSSNGIKERSFSEAESGLAHITYFGPISVSGSISVRSEGSTVSASSFAFPILQSEWNTSPERMVKSDKTQLRKEKGWRQYSLLLCCRF
ncbi:hypothetical protein CARUB_v10009590mg [Capsella rubella]|uniref:Uncharacterized protein n=1 Tax=Capsella rubella TaxID=81985 RepID=R0II55_9BRAS|nr:uncharacterized protein LOC17900901 [Capsella rubella]EOA38120.1 hypothetical protein CARUB_v10009590mg [Capsella rubella]